MFPPLRRPPQPKQADYNPTRPYHRTIQPMLRRHVRLAVGNGSAVDLLVQRSVDEDACRDAEQDADADGNEGEAGLRGAEGVGRVREDVGDCGEEEEEDAEGERGVD